MPVGKSPFFSIVVPVYNKERYIFRCLSNLIQQSYHDFQIVVVNDGSGDRSLDEIKKINDWRVLTINTKNHGVSSARNTGLIHCTGRYVLFVDADDEVERDYLLKIHNELVKNGLPDLLVWGITKIYKDNTKIIIIPNQTGILSQDDFKRVFIGVMEEQEGLLGYISNKAVARDLVISKGIHFRKELRLAEDLDFWIQTYSSVAEIAFCDVCGYLYYQEAENSSVFNQHVDYIQQLNLWSRILKYVNPTNAESLHWFDNKFSGYVSAVFNELDDVTLDNVRELCQKVDEHSKKTTYSLQKSYMVNHVYALGSPLLLFLYLKIREISHCIR